MTPQEQTVILEARDILGRYLSQNPVIGSWQALMRSSASAGPPSGEFEGEFMGMSFCG